MKPSGNLEVFDDLDDELPSDVVIVTDHLGNEIPFDRNEAEIMRREFAEMRADTAGIELANRDDMEDIGPPPEDEIHNKGELISAFLNGKLPTKHLYTGPGAVQAYNNITHEDGYSVAAQQAAIIQANAQRIITQNCFVGEVGGGSGELGQLMIKTGGIEGVTVGNIDFSKKFGWMYDNAMQAFAREVGFDYDRINSTFQADIADFGPRTIWQPKRFHEEFLKGNTSQLILPYLGNTWNNFELDVSRRQLRAMISLLPEGKYTKDGGYTGGIIYLGVACDKEPEFVRRTYDFINKQGEDVWKNWVVIPYDFILTKVMHLKFNKSLKELVVRTTDVDDKSTKGIIEATISLQISPQAQLRWAEGEEKYGPADILRTAIPGSKQQAVLTRRTMEDFVRTIVHEEGGSLVWPDEGPLRPPPGDKWAAQGANFLIFPIRPAPV